MDVISFEAAKLKQLQKRADAIGCYIIRDVGVNDELPPEGQGPYTLMTAKDLGGYEAHIPGVNLTWLEVQITELESDRGCHLASPWETRNPRWSVGTLCHRPISPRTPLLSRL